jgi:hypothetical protein
MGINRYTQALRLPRQQSRFGGLLFSNWRVKKGAVPDFAITVDRIAK